MNDNRRKKWAKTTKKRKNNYHKQPNLPKAKDKTARDQIQPHREVLQDQKVLQDQNHGQGRDQNQRVGQGRDQNQAAQNQGRNQGQNHGQDRGLKAVLEKVVQAEVGQVQVCHIRIQNFLKLI